MRSFVVCALLLAVAASAQAGGVKSRRNLQALEYTCDLGGIIEEAENIVANIIAVVFDVREDIEGIYNGVIDCVNKDIIKPDEMVTCVASTAEDEASAIYDTVEQYISELKSSVAEIKTKLHQCTKL